MHNRKIADNPRAAAKTTRLRVLILFAVLSVVTVLSVFAMDYFSMGELNEEPYYKAGYYYDYKPENVVYIYVDSYTGISVTPAWVDYDIEKNEYGHILVRLMPEPEIEYVAVTVPYGWGYQIAEPVE